MYYGIVLNVGNMVGNIYLNTLISGASEIPAYFLCQLALASPLGRQRSLLLSMLFSGVVLLGTIAVPKGE